MGRVSWHSASLTFEFIDNTALVVTSRMLGQNIANYLTIEVIVLQLVLLTFIMLNRTRLFHL